MKRFIAKTAATLLAAVFLCNTPVSAVSARKYLLIDGVTGCVLQERDSKSRSLIASTTKIMTALLVCEQCNVLDRMRIPKEAVGVEGSSMYLQEGEVLTLQELLYGLMLSSGNDAAVALAIYAGGTVEGFVEQMNDKAHVLGLANTHFENPHGLDSPEHYASAEDLGKLACYAMTNPIFAKTVSTKTIRVGERVLKNHNRLLWSVEGANGVKTGYTRKAGRILVSSAEREERRLVAVTIDAPDDWNDHAELLNHGFSAYTQECILEKGETAGMIPVLGGTKDRVSLVSTEDFWYSLGKTENPQIMIPQGRFVFAPVSAGEPAGYGYLLLGGKAVAAILLEYGQSVAVEEENKKPFWRKWIGEQ